GPVRSLENGEPLELEAGAQHDPDVAFVVSDQDALTRRHSTLLRPCATSGSHGGYAAPPAFPGREAVAGAWDSGGIGLAEWTLVGFPGRIANACCNANYAPSASPEASSDAAASRSSPARSPRARRR